jgi:KipI family sensor histidine kinase inhibitor
MIEVRQAGDAGLLLSCDAPAPWLAASIAAARLPAVLDVVPGARTVLVVTLPGGATAWLAERIAELPVTALAGAAAAPVTIPVVYDGPDLAEVAGMTGLTVEDVIARHAGGHYTVGWLGFSPGFGYLTGLDPLLATVPRRETPRPAVPAGSVAIAAGLAAVYPSASPGGWRLLGRTPLMMWDAMRDPAALLSPGQPVRFQPASADSVPAAIPEQGTADQGTADQGTAGCSGRVAEVVRPGPLATVQDLGRPGLAASAVPPSGAADPASLIFGNRVVGNPDGAAGIELTLGRAAFRFPGGADIAVTGAAAEVKVAAEVVPSCVAIEVPADGLVSIGPPVAGLRSYLTIAGGITIAPVLGSRSADLLSGLGGRPLKAGDLLPIGPAPAAGTMATAMATFTATALPRRGEPALLRVLGGPRLDWFESGALDELTAGTYTVAAASNRTGLRLDGARLSRATDAELPSEGMITGSLQVPPDGRPILLLADHPTTGGYPVIAVVTSADIGLAAQLRPGDVIKFTPASSEYF